MSGKHERTLVNGVAIPGLQALVSGLLFGLVVVSGWGMTRAVTPWGVFSLATSGGCFLAWLAVLRAWLAMYADQAKPAAPVQVYAADTPLMRLAVDWDDGKQGLFSELGITQADFIKWAAAVGQGQSMGENHWCGLGRPFSKSQYHAFRDELRKRGIIRDRGRHHAQGCELSRMGEAVCKEIARRYRVGEGSPLPVGRLVMYANQNS